MFKSDDTIIDFMPYPRQLAELEKRVRGGFKCE